jgi:hypothetical protein
MSEVMREGKGGAGRRAWSPGNLICIKPRRAAPVY